MAAEDQVLQLFYGLTAVVSIETLILILARSDVVYGLKKWYFRKFVKNPTLITYIHADNTQDEYLVSAKSHYVVAGEKVFFLNPAKIKMRKDMIGTAIYTYKNVNPINVLKHEELANAIDHVKKQREKASGENVDKKMRLKLYKDSIAFLGKRVENLTEDFFKEMREVFEPIDPQTIDVSATPEQLRKFMELIDIEAKKNADTGIEKLVKYGKWVVFATIAGAAMSFLAFNLLNGDIVPMIKEILVKVNSLSSVVTIETAINQTIP